MKENKQLWIIDKARKIKKQYTDWRLFKKREPYFKELKKYINDDVSIISSNCFAGRIMQDLHIQYNSPTLGLYFWAADYIEFLSNLKHYLLEANFSFVDHSKYALGDERRNNNSHWYPIGLLDNKVEIHFLHYFTEEEALEKWKKRAQRVNFDNLLIIGMEQNLCNQKCVFDFDKLPFDNKLFFSTYKDIQAESNMYIQEFDSMGEVGNPYLDEDIFYKYLLRYFQNREKN